MLPFRPTPATHTTLRTVVATGGVGLFPRPLVIPASLSVINQKHAFFLPALQQRFGSNFTSPSTSGGHVGGRAHYVSSASRGMDEMMDADIDISDPPEAVGASNAATARAARERSRGFKGKDDIEQVN